MKKKDISIKIKVEDCYKIVNKLLKTYNLKNRNKIQTIKNVESLIILMIIKRNE